MACLFILKSDDPKKAIQEAFSKGRVTRKKAIREIKQQSILFTTHANSEALGRQNPKDNEGNLSVLVVKNRWIFPYQNWN